LSKWLSIRPRLIDAPFIEIHVISAISIASENLSIDGSRDYTASTRSSNSLLSMVARLSLVDPLVCYES